MFGPDGGGGYYLVALRRPCPELFTGVRMSTGGMYGRTLELAGSLGLRVRELEEHLDVDVEADLLLLRERLATLPPGVRPPRTTALVASLLPPTDRSR